MKKTVSFNKNINFKGPIAQINSISLEHEIFNQKGEYISGNFIVSGDYKVTSESMHLDSFKYDLPFNINVDKKYNIDSASIDISDFYYEVINDNVLSVDIELTIDEIKEKTIEEEIMEDTTLDEKTIEPLEADTEEERCVEDEKKDFSIFNNSYEDENYVTYKIHIMTENDTVESVINDYGVKRELLEDYNDLNNIKLGDKIIIPSDEN
ncbi:MAG: hypothetical protein IJ093_02635 [Bacilli bacterium]|nr:hypothetical protein [Bacilli bacterium]